MLETASKVFPAMRMAAAAVVAVAAVRRLSLSETNANSEIIYQTVGHRVY